MARSRGALIALAAVAGVAGYAYLAWERQSARLLQQKVDALRTGLRETAGNDPFFVVDRASNRFLIIQGDVVLLNTSCSTGSGKVLLSERGSRWVFSTPGGRLQVRGKTRDPVWIRPNWAFVEEGLSVPTDSMQAARYDSLSLGEFAMVLGDGYLLHGTLYSNLLGEPVTHGCIRLGDADLALAYRTAKVGTWVYIY